MTRLLRARGVRVGALEIGPGTPVVRGARLAGERASRSPLDLREARGTSALLGVVPPVPVALPGAVAVAEGGLRHAGGGGADGAQRARAVVRAVLEGVDAAGLENVHAEEGVPRRCHAPGGVRVPGVCGGASGAARSTRALTVQFTLVGPEGARRAELCAMQLLVPLQTQARHDAVGSTARCARVVWTVDATRSLVHVAVLAHRTRRAGGSVGASVALDALTLCGPGRGVRRGVGGADAAPPRALGGLDGALLAIQTRRRAGGGLEGARSTRRARSAVWSGVALLAETGLRRGAAPGRGAVGGTRHTGLVFVLDFVGGQGTGGANRSTVKGITVKGLPRSAEAIYNRETARGGGARGRAGGAVLGACGVLVRARGTRGACAAVRASGASVADALADVVAASGRVGVRWTRQACGFCNSANACRVGVWGTTRACFQAVISFELPSQADDTLGSYAFSRVLMAYE